LFLAHGHCAEEDKRIFVFSDELLVLAAVWASHVPELYAVELRDTRFRASVDGKLTLTAVADLTHAVNVLLTVGNFTLVKQG